MDLQKSKILITGGTGFLGRHVVAALKKRGVEDENIYSPLSSEFDLRQIDACRSVVKGVDLVIHLAGKVGGIGFNQQFPAELFYDNAMMGLQMMEESRKANVAKFVAIGTVCSYPKFTPVPFKEEDIWNGYPEETNAPYGLAKKMMLVQSQAYRQQYGFNSIFLIPVNLYGPNDNFDEKSSHVIPSLIKKFYEAKKSGEKDVIVWGSGDVTREFLFVEDAANGIVQAAENYDSSDPVNIGSSNEIKISDLAKLISKIIGFEGNIRFDHLKPDGQPKRKLDVSKALEKFDFHSTTVFEEGLRKTVDWYISSTQ